MQPLAVAKPVGDAYGTATAAKTKSTATNAIVLISTMLYLTYGYGTLNVTAYALFVSSDSVYALSLSAFTVSVYVPGASSSLIVNVKVFDWPA
ncbi:MAG TPA: hypothetical protein VJB68_01215, partial [Methylophilaceae bacterium]|nr:hypothetical protein [Methylophilaceae bacterium]